jgi:monoamine oxidase
MKERVAMSEHHSVIIIGAGLSGLYAAWQLQQKNVDVLVLEARERVGGRILSASSIDLGPAWVWPAFQPRLQALITELNINVFPQYTSGDMLYEMDAQNIQRHGGPSSHNQSYRVVGGNQVITDVLREQLSEGSIHLETAVTALSREPLTISATRSGQGVEYTADKIILALPPRLTLSSMTFSPPLDDGLVQTWNSIPTWMAGHSKMVFIYDEPFWREQGLSGEVFSRQGPLTEIYDGSPEDESFYALTSFVGLNAVQRRQVHADQLVNACMAQLERLFGEASRKVKNIHVSDWSSEPYTSTEMDLESLPQHPQYPESASRSLWDDKIILAGTEVARENGGYLEGAIESAEEALSKINQ